jgi:hypothetical protein
MVARRPGRDDNGHMEGRECRGHCPEHPDCPGSLRRRRPRGAGLRVVGSGEPNAECGRCGAHFRLRGVQVTYLGRHGPVLPSSDRG